MSPESGRCRGESSGPRSRLPVALRGGSRNHADGSSPEWRTRARGSPGPVTLELRLAGRVRNPPCPPGCPATRRRLRGTDRPGVRGNEGRGRGWGHWNLWLFPPVPWQQYRGPQGGARGAPGVPGPGIWPARSRECCLSDGPGSVRGCRREPWCAGNHLGQFCSSLRCRLAGATQTRLVLTHEGLLGGDRHPLPPVTADTGSEGLMSPRCRRNDSVSFPARRGVAPLRRAQCPQARRGSLPWALFLCGAEPPRHALGLPETATSLLRARAACHG